MSLRDYQVECIESMNSHEEVSEVNNARYLNLLFTKLRSKSDAHKSEEVIFEDTYWTYKGNITAL